MDTNNNTYTVIYATVMVVIVAALLALASYLLKDRQQRNVQLETKQQILKSVKLGLDADSQADKAAFIEQLYEKHIVEQGINPEDESLKVYICTMDNGEKMYIVPVHGTGLWGPVWGYVALKSDFNTIYGTTYDHKSETPGLGAEISTNEFSKQFEGKQIFKNGNFESILVVKGGADPASTNEVDAISGGTITSKAVEEMLKKSIAHYLEYFKIAAANATQAENTAAADSTAQTDSTALQIPNPVNQ
jgi:Na+-transporting NADH:ubiquinone oxidoreductase subunit C